VSGSLAWASSEPDTNESDPASSIRCMMSLVVIE